MNLKVDGQTCPVCRAYLFEEDDVVYCPVCGAPHHRECYKTAGHCGLEHLHGSEQQYDRQKYAPAPEPDKSKGEQRPVCVFCKHDLEEDVKVCPYCGRPRFSGAFFQIDLLGGVPSDTDLCDGVTAAEARNFVSVNSQRYIPKFAHMKQGGRVSWNWMAFLFPEGWYFSRKMYKLGALMLTLVVSAEICTIPLLKVMNNIVATDYADYVNYITANIDKIGFAPILLTIIAGVVSLAVKIFSGLFADRFYRDYTIDRLKNKKISEIDADAYNRKYGGVNVFLFTLGIMAAMYLPNIFAMFL